MSTKDYREGLNGKEPGFIDKIIDKEGATDQEHGYQDYLRNRDIEYRLKKSTERDSSDHSSSESDVSFLTIPFCCFKDGFIKGIVWLPFGILIWIVAFLLYAFGISVILGSWFFLIWVLFKIGRGLF